ncbi:MAG: Zn-dependent oligopeptidase, partial [Planctomycetes bacterium]|nr:Zn-dependent oligopeptidase [Planctomycetota bacterium]
MLSRIPQIFALFLACSCAQSPSTLEEFSQAAQARGLVFGHPAFESTVEEVAHSSEQAMATATAALDVIASQDLARVTFESVFAATDDAFYPLSTVMSRFWLMKETRQEPEMREACSEAVQAMSEWAVAVEYREDLYRVCQAYQRRLEAGEVLAPVGEDRKLYEDTMRDYRRAGFALSAETRAQVAALKNELSQLSSDFDGNITQASVVLEFSEDQLTGVGAGFLKSSKTAAGMHAVRATVTPDYMAVMENCSVAETRKALNAARYSTAMEENGPILERLVEVRRQIADHLGYETWADYKIEPKMAGTGQVALEFVESLAAGLQPKFDAEVDALRALKVAETGNLDAVIHWWDFRYYQNQLMKEKYSVDTQSLRHYFALDQVLEGMFDVYQHIFDLRFTQLEPPMMWVEDLQLWAVEDGSSGEPLGLFYLDMFPRPGKYNHFAQFDIIGGKELPDGSYQRPAAALVCNFTPGVDGQPALMTHDEVETIFHEFGHAMHTILTQVKYSRYSGANVARDFVEAPSQMFEAWAWDPTVLADFAVDWRDGSSVISGDTIARMEEAKNATVGIHYRRQMALALTDLRLHMAGPNSDPRAISNATQKEILFSPPADSHFAAYWGHLTGYDAGYYG